MHRNTVAKKIARAALEPDGHIENSAVWHTARVIPVVFGFEPRAPKEHPNE